MPLYAFFLELIWAFLGLPEPFSASLGPFKASFRLFLKKITFFNKNYICIPIKNSNPKHWVSENKPIFGKNRDPWHKTQSANYMVPINFQSVLQDTRPYIVLLKYNYR